MNSTIISNIIKNDHIDNLAFSFFSLLTFCSILSDSYIVINNFFKNDAVKKKINYFNKVFKVVVGLSFKKYKNDNDGNIIIDNNETISTNPFDELDSDISSIDENYVSDDTEEIQLINILEKEIENNISNDDTEEIPLINIVEIENNDSKETPLINTVEKENDTIASNDDTKETPLINTVEKCKISIETKKIHKIRNKDKDKNQKIKEVIIKKSKNKI